MNFCKYRKERRKDHSEKFQKMQQMKIVRRATPIILLWYLAIREFFFFSSSSKLTPSVSPHDEHQTCFVSQFFLFVKPSYLVVFFTFNIIVVALLLGISTGLSSLSSSSSSSPEFPLFSFVDSFGGLKRVKDEDYDDCGGDLSPRIVYVEHKEVKSQDESYDDSYHYKKDIENSDHDQGYDEVLSNENFGCDEEVIMCEEDIHSELDAEDFNKRIQEFIDANIKKWREELQNERPLDLEF